MKKISIHQSQYIPWAPYFKKIAMSDVFVVMDSVQYQKNGVQNRNRIRDKNSDYWLTIPITGNLTDVISEKRLASDRWMMKHWKSIQSAYRSAPKWELYADKIEFLYQQSYSTLFEANQAFFIFLMDSLKINTQVVFLSELQVTGEKSDLVLNICKDLCATEYISGYGSKSYLNENKFIESGVEINYLESISPVYPQVQGEFISGLSMIDMLLNSPEDLIQEYLYSN
ncbi:WbqC family protein [Brevibacillus sp. DP1.3A]|uniref:WbqC family protein n=1 Tax=Brevibacillus sp. DP1.3A TaxID=2738867 RepID=UPI00156ADC5D|nr:WbqC family protein [Brevibacillus sp. DP1.3A]UED75571.1 WbqC family protein [Brevibacillus sp. DP1.3A]